MNGALTRAELIKIVSSHIIGMNLGHPIRVGIDGITAAGKSTFAKELAEGLRETERKIISTTLDGFHFPKEHRYQRGRESAEGYYFDAYNYKSVVTDLLGPLGQPENLKYRLAVFDVQRDEPIDLPWQRADLNSILIVDGSFALRTELLPFWDVKIYLQTDFSIAEDRASKRDADYFKSEEKARQVTKNRYHGAHSIHHQEARPLETATFIILNNDPHYPKIVRRSL